MIKMSSKSPVSTFVSFKLQLQLKYQIFVNQLNFYVHLDAIVLLLNPLSETDYAEITEVLRENMP